MKHKKGVSAMKKIVFLGVLIVFVLGACSAPETSVSDPVETEVLLSTETNTPSHEVSEASQTAAPSPGQSASFEYSSVAEALADLTSRDDVIVEVSQGWTTVTEADGLTIWSFTPSSHPAHPAVAKRVLFKDQEGWQIKMDILCEADKAACDQFVKDFETLNEQMRQYIEQQRP
jgi:hypothetical protein